MKRNLKALLLAMMMVGALSVVGASSAQATNQFHCAVSNCTITSTPDETAGTATAHHLFDVPNNGSITCNQVDVTSTGNNATQTTLTAGTVNYKECKWFGQNATVKMNGCDYLFNASGGVTVGGVECAAKPIEFSIAGCVGKVGPQVLTGIKHHAGPLSGGKKTITIEAAVPGIKVAVSGAACIVPGTYTTGQYTTGNTILTGEEGGTLNMVDVSWTTT